MEKIEALAEYLDVDVDDIEELYDNIFVINDEDSMFYEQEYAVYTDYEADEAVKENVERIADDAGWVFGLPIEDYVRDKSWFDEAQHESNENYAYRIMRESDDVYESRFVAECVERGIIPDDDDWFEEDEDGKLIIVEPIGDGSGGIYDAEDFFDEFVESLDSDFEDGFEWFIDGLGEADIRDFIREGRLKIDYNKLAEDVIRYYGRGEELASSDGHEHELDDYYAYRVD